MSRISFANVGAVVAAKIGAQQPSHEPLHGGVKISPCFAPLRAAWISLASARSCVSISCGLVCLGSDGSVGLHLLVQRDVAVHALEEVLDDGRVGVVGIDALLRRGGRRALAGRQLRRLCGEDQASGEGQCKAPALREELRLPPSRMQEVDPSAPVVAELQRAAEIVLAQLRIASCSSSLDGEDTRT